MSPREGSGAEPFDRAGGMSCICKTYLSALTIPDPQVRLQVSAEAAAAVSASATAQMLLAMDAQVSAGLSGLPAQWLEPPLPQLRVQQDVIVSLATRVQLHAQALAQCGVDLATPIGQVALARLVATLGERLDPPLGSRPPLPDLTPWQELAAINGAAVRLALVAQAQAQAQAAASVTTTAVVAVSVTPPQWQHFVTTIRSVSMLMTIATQMNVSLSAREQFGAAAQSHAQPRVRLPRLPPETLVQICQLSAGFSAIAQLGSSLGVNPMEAGYARTQALVAANVSAAVAALTRARVNVQEMIRTPTAPGVPPIPVLPSVPGRPSFATQAVVSAVRALDMQAVARLEIELEADPSIATGLAVTGFVANAAAALGIRPAAVPCAVCDSRAVMASASARHPG